MSQRRIAILGAGPIGLEAGLYAKQQGYQVTVFERGGIAENVRRWGHVRLFSPFKMNSSEWGRTALLQAGHALPGLEELLTGEEYAERYLLPLARLTCLSGSVMEQSEVCWISRVHALKTDFVGQPERAKDAFRVTMKPGSRHVEADVVIDCTGTFGHHNWVGAGGVPCPGESSTRAGREDSPALNGRIEYGLPDILGRDASRYANVHTLVVGGGYSAATNVVALSMLQANHPRTRVTWLTRSGGEVPLPAITNDQLPERARLTTEANRLATLPGGPVTWLASYVVRRIMLLEESPGQVIEVESVHTAEVERIAADQMIANVGYRPDRSIHEELQVHECYATGGPMRLAAALMGETSADCLEQTFHGADVLRTSEPNFFILGAKSYGRNSKFLIQIGLQQITSLFDLLRG